jgi:ankyrin repeat protein
MNKKYITRYGLVHFLLKMLQREIVNLVHLREHLVNKQYMNSYCDTIITFDLVPISDTTSSTVKLPSCTLYKPNTLDEICKGRYYKRLCALDVPPYLKIKHGIEHNWIAFIERFVSCPLHAEYTLTCATKCNHLHLVQWVLSKFQFHHLTLIEIYQCVLHEREEDSSMTGLLCEKIKQDYPHVEIEPYYKRDEKMVSMYKQNTTTHLACLKSACKYGHFDMVQYLLPSNSSLVGDLLLEACKHNHTQVVEYLLGYGYADSVLLCNQALFIACKQGHLDTVKILLDHCPGSVTGLLYAYLSKRLQVIDYLSCYLSTKNVEETLVNHFWCKGSNSSALTNRAIVLRGLFTFIREDYLKHVYCILENNVENVYTQVPPCELLQAIRDSEYQVVQCLIKYKVNIPSSDWSSALASACKSGTFDLVQLLIDHCLNSIQDNIQYDEAIVSACDRRNHKETTCIMELLKEYMHTANVAKCIISLCMQDNVLGLEYLLANILLHDLHYMGCALGAACASGSLNCFVRVHNVLQESQDDLVMGSAMHAVLKHAEICKYKYITEFVIQKHPHKLALGNPFIDDSEQSQILYQQLKDMYHKEQAVTTTTSNK